MFNKVILLGHLTRDIELRYGSSSTAVGSCGIAVNRKFSVNGEKREEVMFIDITFFGKTAEVANQYLRKGSKLLIEGRLQQDTWQDKSGNTRTKHSVVVESLKMLGDGNSGNPQGGYQGSHNYNQQSSNGKYDYKTKQSHNQSYQPDGYGDDVPDTSPMDDELLF